MVRLNIFTFETLGAVSTIDLSKLTPLELIVRVWTLVQVVVKFSQFTCPLTTFVSICTSNKKLVYGILKFFIQKTSYVFLPAGWAGLLISFDPFNAMLTETLSTASDFVGNKENL